MIEKHQAKSRKKKETLFRLKLLVKRRNEVLVCVMASHAKLLRIHLRTVLATSGQTTRFRVIATRFATSNHLIIASSFAAFQGEKRGASKVLKRLDWQEFTRDNAGSFLLKRHLRMSLESYNKLLSYIRMVLELPPEKERFAKARGELICPEIKLYAALRWLAGTPYSDLVYYCGVSKSALYPAIWSAINAINQAKELDVVFPQSVDKCMEVAAGFKVVSTGGMIDTLSMVIILPFK